MWKATHTETTKASAETIWKCWTNVDSWPTQDTSLIRASLKGPFDLGGIITLRPKKAPAMKLRLALVTPNVGFAAVSKLPFATLQFTYHIDVTPDGHSFTQSVSINGSLAWFYAWFMGPKLQDNLTARMKALTEILGQEK